MERKSTAECKKGAKSVVLMVDMRPALCFFLAVLPVVKGNAGRPGMG